MRDPLPIEPKELIRRLTEGTWERAGSSTDNTTWTQAVKETMAKIATTPPLAFDCLYTNRTPGMREFLLDLVWWDRDKGEGAALGLECEWFFEPHSERGDYADRVVEDFEKLLVFKAPLKVMIFASLKDDPGMQDAVCGKITGYLQQFKHHREGEVYIVIDFAPEWRAWTAEIPRDGLVPEVDLKQIAGLDFSA